jgi:hypothetical protein
MIVQHAPMRWPPNRVVDWADASEREAWVAELRGHLFNLFVVGLDGTKPPWQRSWSHREARESLLANKRVLDQMLHLAGAPLDVWQRMRISLPPPWFEQPPEIAAGFASPFEELPLFAWSAKEQAKWLGYVEGQLEYLVAMLFVVYPEGSEEHRRARWAVIRLRVFFEKLRVALATSPLHA